VVLARRARRCGRAGITVIGFQTSYAIPIFLKLLFYKDSLPHFHGAGVSLGAWSWPLGVISCVWLFGTSILFFLPQEKPVNKESMNYSCVVVGGTAFIALVYWLVYARHKFTGPKRSQIGPGGGRFVTSVQAVENPVTAVDAAVEGEVLAGDASPLPVVDPKDDVAGRPLGLE
jgi:hypothetical protein